MLTEIPTDSTQLFAGARLSKTNPECTACNRTLREGEQVTIYATRQEDAPTFTIERCYCRECTPEELTSPTLGLSEHLLRSRLTRTLNVRTQSEFQTLGDIHTLDASAPSEGTAEAHDEEPPTALLRDTHIQNPASAVYHIDDGEGQPLCNCETNAQYTPVPLAEAEASTARQCGNCQIARQGEQATQPCPHCNAPVGMSAWPQHVRACGDPTDAATETDPDGDPAITDTQRATSPVTRTGVRTQLHQRQE